MGPALDPARHWLAAQIRARVVGDEPARQIAMIRAPGARWFGPDRAIRTVHADAAMFVGGLRALLLQSLHPLAMAGVAEHSDFRHDPWGRLQRTSEFLAATTFGPVDVAERAIAVVRAVHERVHGVAPDGRPYDANDPHLLLWVHLCEVDSFLRAHQRYGARRLSEAEADEYVADSGEVARRLGVIDPPTTVAEVGAGIAAFRGELRSTRAARDAARFLLVQPPLPLAARAPYAVLAATAVSMLPAWARLPLRVPLLPVSERMLVRPAGAALTGLIRWSLAADVA